MIAKIFQDKTLASNFDLIFTTENTQIQVGSMLQFAWDSVTGTRDGVLDVYIVNGELATKVDTIDITTASNTTDCYGVQLNYVFEALRFVYTKNNITAGNLNVNCTQTKLRG